MTRGIAAGTAAARAEHGVLPLLAVLVSFTLGDLESATDDSDVIIEVLAQAEPVVTPSGPRWALPDRMRCEILAATPIRALRSARRAASASESPLQTALDRSLAHGWTPDELAAMSGEEARSLLVVAGWWDGRRTPKVPKRADIASLVDRINLFSEVRAMAADRFVGRRDLLKRLARDHDQPGHPTALYGVGGIGKSALIARHIEWMLDGARGVVALLDFDDASINPKYSADVVTRIISLVGRQSDSQVRKRLDRLIEVARDSAERGFRGLESSSRGISGSTDEIAQRRLIEELERYLPAPLVVIFDTVEQIPRRGSAAVHAFAGLVRSLTRSGKIRVLTSGRIAIPEVDADPIELKGLTTQEATRLLTDVTGHPVPVSLSREVIGAFGTAPLTIRLIGRLLAAEDDLSDLLGLQLQTETINGVLYRRVLDHIKDKDVRKLAHPGLVLRRVTPDLIQSVLARACALAVPDRAHANDLFERLAREGMLVDRTREPGVLVHRADVRSLMLPQLLADRPSLAAKIQRAAVKYYSSREGREARTEELYHRLMLKQAPATLDRRWDVHAAAELFKAKDELPEQSRIHLTRRLPETFLDANDRRLLDDERWKEEVGPQAEQLIADEEGAAAIALLRERRRPEGGSLLPGLEITALEVDGAIGVAIEVARDSRRRAALANNLAGVAEYTLHLSRLLERDGGVADAKSALDETLDVVDTDDLARLRLLLARLGIARRSGGDNAATLGALRHEADEIASRLPRRALRATPGLMRDLAAELGTDSNVVLENALRSIGVDATSDGSIAQALRDLDENMPPELERGRVTSLVIGDNDGAEPIATTISSMPRGETGRKLLDVLDAFGSEADDLRSAVTNDFQVESDAALFGKRRDVGRKV